MKKGLVAGCLALALALPGPATPPEPELEKARSELERVRALVEAGALPRKALQEAELVLEEAADEAALRRILYGVLTVEELTEAQAGAMLGAAQRMVERQQRELDKARRMVAEGALPLNALDPFVEELERRRQTLDLAHQRARLFQELVEIARAEEVLAAALEDPSEEAAEIAHRFDGSGVFLPSHLAVIRLSFERQFGRPLPISASGDTAIHRALGFDHRGRVDVALHPDQPEGRWLLALLEEMRIPYFAFRTHLPGKSTGAHIHLGPPSGSFKGSD